MPENEQKPAAPAAKSGGSGLLGIVLVLLAAAYGYLHFVAHAAIKIGSFTVR